MTSTATDETRTCSLLRKALRAACFLLLLFAFTAPATMAQVTVVSKSGPFFIINNKQSRNHLGNYVGYEITNASASTYSDLTARLTNFQGGVVSLGDNEDGLVNIGSLAPGASKMAYFFLKASGESTVVQSHDLEVYDGDPGTPVAATPSTFSFVQTGDFTPVFEAIAASANKVDSIRVSGTPTLGGTFVMTVYGRTGVIGSPGDVLFSPSTFPTWPADNLELASSVISIGNPVTRTIPDSLYANLAGLSNQPYTLVYTFRVNGTTTGSTTSSPLSYLTSGQKVKHEDLSGNPSIEEPVPEVFQVTLDLTVSDVLLEPLESDPNGGTVTYTVTFTNPGTVAVDLDRIEATLPDSSFGGGAPGDVTYGGNSTFDGTGIADPSISDATLTWPGSFTIPAGGSVTLTFEAVFPKVAGAYTAASISIFTTDEGSGSVEKQVDTTADMTDDVPGQATTVVSDVNLPVELTLFEVLLDGRTALLAWETASEVNNAGFEVQRLSKNDAEWQVLGWVEGYGTTELTQAYSYRVEGLEPGRHVFRLKQVDYDGTFEYHPEVEVIVEMAERFVMEPAYPNPFNPQAQFRFAVSRSQVVRVDLYDMLGRRVKVLYAGEPLAGQMQTVGIDGSGLPSGVYVVRLVGETLVTSQPVTLLK